jgi:hypothetical protein
MHRLTGFTARTTSVILLSLACADPGATDPSAHGASVAPSVSTLRFSEWSTPANLGPAVNSSTGENAPELSRDGLSLYFGSPRAGGTGSTDLWVSRRSCADVDNPECAWQPAVNLGPTVNAVGIDAAPNLSRDGHFMYFTSDRPGGLGSNDLWVSYREDVHDDFAWQTPVNVGAPINSDQFDGGPSIGRPEFYFARGTVPDAPPAGPPADIWVSRLEGEIFGQPEPVAELNGPGIEQSPALRFDGREILLSSSSPGGFGLGDIVVSTRQSHTAPWAIPTNLGPTINTEFEDSFPVISSDGLMLIFASRRPWPEGESCGLPPLPRCDFDLYVSTRTRLPDQ